MTASRFPLLNPAPRVERADDPLAETTVGEETLFDGRFMHLVREEIRLPDGAPGQRLFLTHPGAAAIVALYEDGSILLERQWRHPMKRSFWEIPAGKLDPNESELVCAQRELKEECGVAADRWSSLGTLHNAIGYSNEHIAVFLAEGLTEGAQELDDGEWLEVVRVPLEEALAMARDGRITDVKTIVALFWTESKLRGLK